MRLGISGGSLGRTGDEASMARIPTCSRNCVTERKLSVLVYGRQGH